MVYDPQFSPKAAEFFFVLTGLRPPAANRETMLAVRDALLQAGDRVEVELSPQLSELVSRVLMGMDTAVSPEFAKSMEAFTSAPPFYLPAVADQYRQLANYTETSADEFLKMKVNSIVILASLLVAIAIDIAIAVFFPELGLELLAAEFVIVRFLLFTTIGRLLMHLVLTMVMSIAIQEALDMIGQLVIDKVLHQSWDWEETLQMLEVGALGGAMGLVLMPVDHMLGDWLGHLLVTGANKALGKAFGVALGDAGEGLLHGIGEFGSGVLVGGVHNAGHETLFQGMQGNGWNWNWGTFAGGAAQGVTGVAARGLLGASRLPNLIATMPAELLLLRGVGPVNPAMLGDIATFGGDKPGGGGALSGGEAAGAAVPPAVALLSAAGVPAGPDTAYRIALRTGFVPTIGQAHEQGAFSKPVLARVPMSGFLVQPGAQPGQQAVQAGGPPLAIGSGSQPAATPVMPASPARTGQSSTVRPLVAGSLTVQPAVEPVTQQPLTGAPAVEPVTQQPLTGQSAVEPVTQQTPTDPRPDGRPEDLRRASQQPASEVTTTDARSLEPAPPESGPLQPDVPLTDRPLPKTELPKTELPKTELPNADGTALVVERPVENGGTAPGEWLALSPQPKGEPGQPGTLDPVSQSGSQEPVGQTTDPPAGQPNVQDGGAERFGNSSNDSSAAGPASGPPPAEPSPGGPEGRTGGLPAGDPGQPGGPAFAEDPVKVPQMSVTDPVGGGGGLTAGKDPAGVLGVGDAVGPRALSAAGTRWMRNSDGWYVSEHDGVLERGPGADGQSALVEVPAGSKSVFDGSGELRHVVLPGGVSYERGLDGVWSPPRERPGDLVVIKTGEPVELRSGDGTTTIVLRPENEVVRDESTGSPVAYRQVKAGDGSRLGQPRTFLPDGMGNWAQTRSPVDAATYEGWLASANKAHDAAQTLYDIAARSGPGVPEQERLTNLDAGALRNLLQGTRDDAIAAIYEAVRRAEGVALRWTQLSASHAFTEGKIVNMAAGEGKSWLFLVDAARQAVLPHVDSVHVITTRGNLADREFEHYHKLLTPLGFAVHRMNSDAPPPPRDGRPTIYVGTSQDVGFTYLKTDLVPGQQDAGHLVIHAGVDEIDEAFVYSNTQYILSEGVQGAASASVAAPVKQATTFLAGHLNSGHLSEADFGRAPGQAGGPAALTGHGQQKVAQLLGRPPTGAELAKLNMAATAHWEYVENVHYVVHDGKVYIIDQTTHEVLYNPETATESRWNGGLAQAVEAKHGLTIRDDPSTSKTVTAQQLYATDGYQRVVGASGTALGKGERFAQMGLSPQIEDIPRYYSSRLGTAADHVSPDLPAKLDVIAGHVRDMQAGPDNQPQLILAHRNDLVAGLSQRLTDMGVPHTAIDARWFLDQGTSREAAFKQVIDQAGQPGQVLVINMQGARGVDIPVSDQAKALGGLHVRVTARSGVSQDIDIQAENRAARSGDPGSVSYYISPDDQAFHLSHNPDVQLAVIKYTEAFNAHTDALTTGDRTTTNQTQEALTQAETVLRNLIPLAQAEAAGRMGMYTPTHLPNAPPTGTSPAPATTTASPPTNPPPQLPSGQPFTSGAGGSGLFTPPAPAVVKTSSGVYFATGTASSSLTEQAAAAVPGAVSGNGGRWKTVGGHATPSHIEIHGTARRTAEALELPGVQESLQTAEAIVLNLCYALSPAEGLPSVAEDFAATGKPVLAADQQVIVAGKEVISGEIAYDENGLPRVVRSGTWKLLAGGAVRDLQTPSLLDAYAKLGLTPLPAGPAPAELVAFSTPEPELSEQEQQRLDPFRRAALQYMGQPRMVYPPGVTEQEAIDGLAAVLAEAGDAAGDAPRTAAWNVAVTLGLGILSPAPSLDAYAESLPGIDPASLRRGQVFTVRQSAAGHAGGVPESAAGTVYEIEVPNAASLAPLTGTAGMLMFRPGTRFEVTGIVEGPDGRRTIGLRHPARRLELPALPVGPAGPSAAAGGTALPQGWEWLDQGRGLAIPVDPVLTGGIVTDREGWRSAAPGDGRDYAVHLPTGVMVLADRTVLRLTDGGWVRNGRDLVHLTAGVSLRFGGATVGQPDPGELANLRAIDLVEHDAQLSRDDLVQWLVAHGGLAGEVPGVATGLGWQHVLDEAGGRRWVWNATGPTDTLPPGLEHGTASGAAMRCLIDSLSQLMRAILPDGQRQDMTPDFLADWFADHLPFTNEAYEQLLNEEMIDVWSTLDTFTNMFQVRVQVFEYGPDHPISPRFVTVNPRPLRGPARDQDGNLTPVLHLYWRGAHFEPLLAEDPGTLPLREPLGAGPQAVAARVRLDRERHLLTQEMAALAAHTGLAREASDNFTRTAEEINQTWRSLEITIDPQTALAATQPLRDVVGRLAGLRDTLRGVIDSLTGTVDLTEAQWLAQAADVRTRVAEALKKGLSTHVTHTQDGDGRTWPPDRAAVHEEIIEELSQAPGVPREGAALIAGGLPGAGKSTLVAQLYLGDQPRYLLVDMDDIVLAMHRHGLIPEVEGLTPREAAQLVRQEANHIWYRLMDRVSGERINLAIVGMMSTPGHVDEPMQILRPRGYTRFEALFVDVPVDDAQAATDARHRRGHERWRRGEGPGGHYVPPSVFVRDQEFGSANRRVFERARGTFDHWSLYRRRFGEAAHLVAQGGPGVLSPLTDGQWEAHVTGVADSLLNARAAGQATHLTQVSAPGHWTRARAAVQQSVADHLYQAASGVPQEAEAVITGGPWLAGASALAQEVFRGPDAEGPAYLVLDPHVIERELAQRGLIPQVQGVAPLEAAFLVQQEVRQIAALVLSRAIEDRRNVLIADDMTDRRLTGERIRQLRIGGYEVAGVFLDVSPDDALQRDQREHRLGHERWRAGQGHGGRFIPPETIPLDGGIGTSLSRRNFDALQDRLNSWRRWELHPSDQRPRLTAEGSAEHRPLPVLPPPPGTQSGPTREQQAALRRFGYQSGYDAAQAHRAGSFFTALMDAAAPQLQAWFAARGVTARPVSSSMVRRAMADALALDLQAQAPRYERFLPPDRGLRHLRNQLAEEGEDGLDEAVLAVLAPHLAADTFGLRLAVMGVQGLVYGAGVMPARHTAGGPDGRELMIIRMPRGRFAAAQSLAASPGHLTDASGLPRWPDLQLWPPSPVATYGSVPATHAGLIEQEGEHAVLDNSARIQREADLARLEVAQTEVPDLLPDGPYWEEVRDIIAEALKPGGDEAWRDLGILEYIGQESLFRNENRIMAEHEAQRIIPVLRRHREYVTAPNGWAQEPYFGAMAELVARLELAEEILGPAERIISRDAQQPLTHQDLGVLQHELQYYRQIPAERERAQREAAAAEQAAWAQAAGLDAEAQLEAAGQASELVYRERAAAMIGRTGRDVLAWVRYAIRHPDDLRYAVQQARQAATRAQRDETDLVRQPAKKAAEWLLLERFAQAAQLDQQPPRLLPPGFGQAVAPAETGFSMGPTGLAERLGDADFSDDEAIARELLRAMPADAFDTLRGAIARALRRELRRLGPRRVAQRMLEGGLEFGVDVGVLAYPHRLARRRHLLPTLYIVRISLEPDLSRAEYLSPAAARRDQKSAPVHDSLLGQRHHIPVEAAHEALTSARLSSSNARSVSLTANGLVPLQFIPTLNRAVGVTGQVSAGAESTVAYSSGSDSVSGMKRVFDLSGERARFDVPAARLTMRIQRVPRQRARIDRIVDSGARTYYRAGGSLPGPIRITPPVGARPWARRPPPTRVRIGTAETSMRLSFPREFAPPTDWRRPGPVLSAAPAWAANPVLGLTAADLAAGAHLPPGPQRGAFEARARRVAEVLGLVSAMPESAPGMGHLARQVLAAMPSDHAEPGSKLHEGITEYVSELTVLIEWDDVIAAGAISPAYTAKDTSKAANLSVQAVMRSAQRAMTNEERSSAADPVGLKAEHQRFVNNAAASVSEGGKASLSGAVRAGPTFGSPTAPFGHTQAFAGQYAFGAGIGASRTSAANVGSGEVRGLVYKNSVRYRLMLQMTVSAYTDIHGVGRGVLVTRDVPVFVWIPRHETARFEDLIRRALLEPGTRAYTAATKSLGPAADPGPGPVAVRYPPASVDTLAPLRADMTAALSAQPGAAGLGMGLPISRGFSVIEQLAGAEKIIPTITRLLAEGEADKYWAPRWSPLDEAAMLRQLSSRYSRQALTNGPDLFGPAGVREILARGVNGGTEVIEIEAFLLRPGEWSAIDRIAEAKAELMPAAFSGASSGDSLAPEASHSLQPAGVFGLGGHPQAHRLRQLGPAYQHAWKAGNRPATATTTSAFQLMAMLYDGPVRGVTYEQSAYFVTVRVTYLPSREALTRLGETIRGLAVGAVRAIQGHLLGGYQLLTPAEPDNAQLHGALIMGGQVRYVFAEPVTPTVRRQAAGIGDLTGPVVPRTVPARLPPALAAGGGVIGFARRLFSARELHDLFGPPALGPGNRHTQITTADVVMEPLGAQHLQEHLSILLRRAGLPDHYTGDISWTVTGADFQAAAAAGGPSPILASVVAQGYWSDRHATIVIEGFPVNGQEDGERFAFLKMRVAEGGPEVTGSRSRERNSAWQFSNFFGAVHRRHGMDTTFQFFPGFTAQGDVNAWVITTAETARAISGALVQQQGEFSQNVADMLWRITVIRQDKNLLWTFPPAAFQAMLTIGEGLSYLRPVPARRDLDHPPAPAAPAPRLIRAARPGEALPGNGQNGDQRLIPTFRTTPGQLDVIPREPIVPHLAATTDVLPGPPSARRPAGQDGTGERATAEDRLIAMIRAALRQAAPGALDALWERADNGQAVRLAPVRLEAFFRPGTLASVMDTLLYGLRLRSSRSLPGCNERVEIEITAYRDPGGHGYQFQEYVPESTVSRYMFKLNREGREKVTSSSLATAENLRIADNPPFLGRYAGFAVTPRHSSSRGRSAALSQTGTNASRNTIFLSQTPEEGKAYHIAGELEIAVEVRRVRMWGPLLNAGLGTVPRRLTAPFSDPGDPLALQPGRPDAREAGRFTEIVLVPPGLDKPDLEPLPGTPRGGAPDAGFAVQVIPPAALRSPQRVPFPITGQHIRDRAVLVLGVDPVRMRLVRNLVLSSVRGYPRPRLRWREPQSALTRVGNWRARNSPAIRVLSPGTAGLDGLYAMFAPGMIGLQLPEMLDGFFEFPGLFSEGGLLTDNHVDVAARAWLVNPRVHSYFQGRLESVSYHFDEQGQRREINTSHALDVTPASTGTSGNILAPPGSSAQQKITGIGNVSLSRSRGQSGAPGRKLMTRATPRSQQGPFLRVTADLVLHIVVDGSNRRWWLTDRLPTATAQQTVTTIWIRDAVELAVAPWFVPSAGLPQPLAMPAPSGLYFPDRRLGRPDERMRAAFAVPRFDDLDMLHVATNGGQFMVGGRDLTAEQFVALLTELGMNARDRRSRPLVLIANGTSYARHDRGSLAGDVATEANRPVIGTDGHVIITPDGAVLAWTFRYDGLDRPIAGSWQRGRWYLHLPGGRRVALGQSPDLMVALQDVQLRRFLRRPGALQFTRSADHPPLTAVRWGTAQAPDITPEPSTAAGLLTVPTGPQHYAPTIISGVSIVTSRPGEAPGEIIDIVTGLYFTAAPEYSTSLDEAAARSVPVPDGWVVIAGHGDRNGLRSGDIQLTPDQVVRLDAFQDILRDAEGIVVAMCEADQLAGHIHGSTRLPVVASTHQFIVTPDGDPVSGRLDPVDRTGRPVVLVGEFVAHVGGQRHPLGTRSLIGAYAAPHGPGGAPLADLSRDEAMRARRQAPHRHIAFPVAGPGSLAKGVDREDDAEAAMPSLAGPGIDVGSTPGYGTLAELAEQVRRYRAGIGVSEWTDAQRERAVWQLLAGPRDAVHAALALISAESDPTLARLFGDGRLFAALASAIPPGHLLHPILQRLVGARFAGGWAALEAGQVQPTGQPDGTFSLAQISPDLAGLDVGAALTGEQLARVAAAVAALPATAIPGIGRTLLALPLAQRALAASSLAAIRAALRRAAPEPGPAAVAADRLARLLTPLRRSAGGLAARFGSPGDVPLGPPAGAPLDPAEHPDPASLLPTKVTILPQGPARSRAPRPVATAPAQADEAAPTSSQQDAVPDGAAGGDAGRLVAQMNYLALFRAPESRPTQAELSAAATAVRERVGQVLARRDTPDAPPPEQAMAELEAAERSGLVLYAATRLQHRLYQEFQRAVQQITPVTGMDERQAEAVRASALERNNAAAARAARIGMLSELPEAMETALAAMTSPPAGGIREALESAYRLAERRAQEASDRSGDAEGAAEAFAASIGASLPALAGWIVSLASALASSEALMRTARQLPPGLYLDDGPGPPGQEPGYHGSPQPGGQALQNRALADELPRQDPRLEVGLHPQPPRFPARDVRWLVAPPVGGRTNESPPKHQPSASGPTPGPVLARRAITWNLPGSSPNPAFARAPQPAPPQPTPANPEPASGAHTSPGAAWDGVAGAVRGVARNLLDQGRLRPPAGMTREEAVDGLAAVLAEAAGRRGKQPSEQWNRLVAAGLRLLPLTGHQLVYARSLPGIDPGRLTEGAVFTVADPVTGRAGLGDGTPDGTLYVVWEPEARDVSGLVGQEPGTVMFPPGTRFEVTGISAGDDGRRIVLLRHPGSRPASPAPGTGEPGSPAPQ